MTTFEPPAGLDLAPIRARAVLADQAGMGPGALWAVRASANDVPALCDEIEALRAAGLKAVAHALLAEAEAFDAKWNRPRSVASDWDRGYVAGMQRAAHDVANSIDRPEVLTEVRDETKGTSDDG